METGLSNTEKFALQLLEWFYKVKRDLPWRRSRDPYAIWVSEIMLQQTRVETVIPYFERFMQRFPSINELADAPEEDVLKHWEGLGYYSRVRNLQSAAREVKAEYGGVVPADPERFIKLKGIGSYTKGAVMSIAYQIAEPAVDGNVMRVMTRWCGWYDDIAAGKTKTKIEEFVRTVIPRDQPGDFNQALMELGSQVCTPKSPSCERCPVQLNCMTFANGWQNELPVKTKLKSDRVESRWVAVVTRRRAYDGEVEVLVRQRPDTGLLAKLWEFPHEIFTGGEAHEVISESLRFNSDHPKLFWQGTHVFSHLKWQLDAYYVELLEDVEIGAELTWFGPEERAKYAFAQAFTVIWQAFENRALEAM